MLSDLYTYIVSQDTTGLDSARATALATIRGLIGTRMYPDTPAEGITDPSLSYQLVSGGVDHYLEGPNDGLFHDRVQFDAWTFNPTDRETLATNLITALDGFIGSWGTTTVNIVLWDNLINSYEPDRKYYRAMLDFRVHYS